MHRLLVAVFWAPAVDLSPLTRALRSLIKHFVENKSDQDRIHLVVDVAETLRERTPLHVGQVCEYKGGNIVC